MLLAHWRRIAPLNRSSSRSSHGRDDDNGDDGQEKGDHQVRKNEEGGGRLGCRAGGEGGGDIGFLPIIGNQRLLLDS